MHRASRSRGEARAVAPRHRPRQASGAVAADKGKRRHAQEIEVQVRAARDGEEGGGRGARPGGAEEERGVARAPLAPGGGVEDVLEVVLEAVVEHDGAHEEEFAVVQVRVSETAGRRGGARHQGGGLAPARLHVDIRATHRERALQKLDPSKGMGGSGGVRWARAVTREGRMRGGRGSAPAMEGKRTHPSRRLDAYTTLPQRAPSLKGRSARVRAMTPLSRSGCRGRDENKFFADCTPWPDTFHHNARAARQWRPDE